MTLKEKIKKHKDKPVSLIFFGSNYLGIELAKVLIDQGSLVIALDSVENQNEKLYTDLIENENFVVIDKLGINSLKSVLERLDYSFYFSRVINKTKVGAKKFQEEISILEDCMNLSLDKEAKFLMIDSIDIHRRTISELGDKKTTKTQKSYTITEQQVYYEKLVLEYIDKYKLQASIVRMGKVYGPDMEFDSDDRLSELINEAITKDKIVISGDGLEEYYFVYITDAVYALLKAQFSSDSKGKILSCRDEAETTELGIVYALIEHGYRAREVSFVDKEVEHLEKDDTESLSIIGWNPKVSLPRGIKIVVDEFVSNSGIKIDQKIENFEDEEQIEIKSPKPKSESESIMEVMSESYKKDALDSGVKEKSNDKRLKRVMGFGKKKQDSDKTVQIKAQKRKDKTTTKGKWKTIMKISSIVLFFVLYLFFFAPIIKASFNSLLSNRLFNSLEYNIEQDKITEAISTIESLQTSLESQQKSIASLNRINFNSYIPLERVFTTEEEINSMLLILEDIKNSLEYEKIMADFALESSFELGNQLDSDEDIEIIQKGIIDDSGLVQNPVGVLEDYTNKIEEYKRLNSSIINSSFLYGELVIEKLENIAYKYKISETFLGLDGESTSMIVFIDNSANTILGGDARAYALINMKDSKLENIEVNNIETNSAETAQPVETTPEATTPATTETTTEEAPIKYEDYELALDNIILKISNENKPKYIEKIDNVLVMSVSNIEKIIKQLGSVETDKSTITAKNLNDYIKDEDYEAVLRALVMKVITLDPESRSNIIKFIYTDIQNGEIKIISPLRDYILDPRMITNNEIKIITSELPILDYKGEKLEKERFLELEIKDKMLFGIYTIDFKIDDKASFKTLISFNFPKNTVIKTTKGMQNPITRTTDSSVIINGLLVGDPDKTTVSPEVEFEIPIVENKQLFSIENTPSYSEDLISIIVKKDSESNYESDVLVETDNALSTTRRFSGLLNFELSL